MAAVATAGVAKVASALGSKLKEKLGGDDESPAEAERVEHADNGAYGHAGVRQ